MSPSSEPGALVGVLRRRAATTGHRVAYRFLPNGGDEVREITYAELDLRARAVAVELRRSCAPGERVLLAHPPGLEFIVDLFGCFYAGLWAVPAYPPRRGKPDARIAQILADSGASVALTTNEHLPAVEAVAGENGLRTASTEALDTTSAAEWTPLANETADVALLQYTSGSTLAPRGVMVTHGNLLANVAETAAIARHGSDATLVSWLPHFHDMGLLFGVMQPLYEGCTGCLMPAASFLQQPALWLHAISRWRAKTSGAPNFAWELCAERVRDEQKAGLDLSCWQFAFSGAETIRAETLERFLRAFAPYGFRREAICPGYGLAEATLRVSSARGNGAATFAASKAELRYHRAVAAAAGNGAAQAVVSCGRPSADTHVLIVDPGTLEPCAEGSIGEIWVAGPGVARGYWNRPEETRATFEARTASGEGPFLRTGDLGFLHGGELYFTGRLKELIIIRGLNHHPADIELTVERAHADLRPHCGAAFAVEAADGERLVIVQEVDRQRRDPQMQDIFEPIVAAVTEEHGVEPWAIVLIRHGSCPKTTSGKTQRGECRKQFLEGTLKVLAEWRAPEPARASAAATDPSADHSEAAIREWLIARIAQRSGADPRDIDPGRAFVQFGIGSAETLALVGELESWLGRKLSPVLIWNYPNIDALARHLGR